MAKGNQKSSASSGTRKKNARKAALATGEQPVAQNQRKSKKEKGKSKEPKVKVYIPPSKPKPIQPDPLETTGIAHQLPADLLIILKAFGKKDVVTKGKALERLQLEWLDRYQGGVPDEVLVSTLSVMLPVWVCPSP
jgi:E3 ubiquitin-protein ligase listerin